MPLSATCPHCGAVFQARDDSAGERVTCPNCQRPVAIPPTDQQLLASIRTACWTIAGILIASLAFQIIAGIVALVSKPTSRF